MTQSSTPERVRGEVNKSATVAKAMQTVNSLEGREKPHTIAPCPLAQVTMI